MIPMMSIGRMPRKGMCKSVLLVTALVLFGAGPCPFAASGEKTTGDLDRTVAYLLQYVARSNLVFIRNGVMHSPAEAEVHMRRKFDYFKGEIRTPEDFIRLCATKSTLTGRPYQVKLADGRLLRCDQWMLSVLSQYRRETGRLGARPMRSCFPEQTVPTPPTGVRAVRI